MATDPKRDQPKPETPSQAESEASRRAARERIADTDHPAAKEREGKGDIPRPRYDEAD